MMTAEEINEGISERCVRISFLEEEIETCKLLRDRHFENLLNQFDGECVPQTFDAAAEAEMYSQRVRDIERMAVEIVSLNSQIYGLKCLRDRLPES